MFKSSLVSLDERAKQEALRLTRNENERKRRAKRQELEKKLLDEEKMLTKKNLDLKKKDDSCSRKIENYKKAICIVNLADKK